MSRVGAMPGLRAAAQGLDAAALRPTRWAGLEDGETGEARVIETFGLDDGSGLTLLELGPTGSPVRLTLPSDDPLLAGAADQGPWAALHRLASGGGVASGDRGGRLVGRPIAPRRGGAEPMAEAPTVNRSPGDQSHTSVIIDDTSTLKLYRRLPDGPNPEVEVLRALTTLGTPGEAPAVPVPPLIGWVDHERPDGSTVPIAIEQVFIEGAADAFEACANELVEAILAVERAPRSRRAPAALEAPATLEAPEALRLAADVGRALDGLHTALASVDLPGFRPAPASPATRRSWLARALERLDLALAGLRGLTPADETAARAADALEVARPALAAELAALGETTIQARVLRVHGDLHFGQVLLTPAGVWLVDFEGDPLRDPTERVEPASPGRDLAGFLRSLDHVARSGARRAREALGRPLAESSDVALETWISRARRAFLQAYADPVGPVDPRLLRAFELEKGLLELRYAARYLPSWLYAPAQALPRLLAGEPDVSRTTR